VEPYVGEEIEELERRGVHVTACSVWHSNTADPPEDPSRRAIFTVFTWRPWLWLSALALCIRRSTELKDILQRLAWTGNESWGQRVRGLAHTLLGARLALLLSGSGVRHIHVHHGYLAAWIGMVAARLLQVPYSLTLHGSDLLLRPTFLDIKLRQCAICFTVSEFNRDYLLQRYPQIDPGNVLVQRIGVQIPLMERHVNRERLPKPFTLLAVGRLHAVKDHAFLMRACAVLKASGQEVHCRIAGEGPDRQRLETLIRSLGLTEEVRLLGHVPRNNLAALYREADLVVLTSQSEGLPVALMEAMALGRPVLAPAITGIPELVLDGETGFLYRQDSITDFVDRVEIIRRTRSALGPICQAAHERVNAIFNLETNLQKFSDVFLYRILGAWEGVNADSVLQQVQL
jgi:glycosyltransferase involved in cell wall biosynthesis